MQKNDTAFNDRQLIEARVPPLHAEVIEKYGFFIWNVDISDGVRDDFRTAPVRRYDFWCLSHVLSGRGACWLEGKGRFEMRPGTVVLVAPGERNLLGGLSMRGYREDFIAFGGPLFERMRELGLLESGCGSLGAARRLPALAELRRDPSSESYWRCGMMLQKLLLEIHDIRRDSGGDSPIAELIREIRNDPGRWWTLADMAERCHRSEEQTRRLFLRHTGMTPKPYVEAVKLRRAAEMLTGTSHGIDEIARELGFRDRFHFSRRFKTVIGLPPASYREHSIR